MKNDIKLSNTCFTQFVVIPFLEKHTLAVPVRNSNIHVPISSGNINQTLLICIRLLAPYPSQKKKKSNATVTVVDYKIKF